MCSHVFTPSLSSRSPDPQIFFAFPDPPSPLRQSSLWISRKIINSGRWGEEPADASVTIYLIIAPSKIWQDGSSKLKVDGEFGKVGTVGSAQQKIWQDGPGSHKFWGKHGHVRLARACATDMLVLALVTSLGTVLLPARGFLRRLTLANQRRGGEGPRRDAARSQGVPERSRRAQRAQRACPNPGACPAPRRTSVQAQPHRLRSKRDATRRPGAAGGCGAALLGQRVRGRPPRACKS